MHKLTTSLCALALIAAAGATPTAQANVTKKEWNTFNDYAYQIIQMPDLDQRRSAAGSTEGLPGGGNMYCVPTASINLMAYAARHGFPGVSPGNHNFQLQANYDLATATIDTMGDLMGTTASGGTGGAGWETGVNTWLSSYCGANNGQLTYTRMYASGNYSPMLPTLAKLGTKGSIVSFAYGYYTVTGYHLEAPVIQRGGGHAVTLARAEADGFIHDLWVRDPADDSANLYTQSTFGSNYRTVDNTIAFTSHNDNAWRFISHINSLGDATHWRIIDEYVAVKPKEGYAWKPFLTYINVFSPLPKFIDLDGPDTLPLPGGVVDAAVGIDPGALLVLVKPEGKPNELVEVDTDTGKITDLAVLPDAKKLVFGRKREFYTTDGGKLYCYKYDDGVKLDAAVSSVPNPHDLAYDDLGDKLVVLSLQNRLIAKLPEKFNGPASNYFIPTNIPVGDKGGVGVGPDGTVWMVTSASDIIYGFKQGPTGEVLVKSLLLPAVQDPTDITVDDRGHLFVCINGANIIELQETAAAGWQVVANSPFSGGGGTNFLITRSRTNFDPELHSGPEWNNVPADEVDQGGFAADCPGDLNNDLVIDSTDLNLLLAGFGTLTGADLDRDGDCDSLDLNILLANFGSTCQ